MEHIVAHGMAPVVQVPTILVLTLLEDVHEMILALPEDRPVGIKGMADPLGTDKMVERSVPIREELCPQRPRMLDHLVKLFIGSHATFYLSGHDVSITVVGIVVMIDAVNLDVIDWCGICSSIGVIECELIHSDIILLVISDCSGLAR